MKKLLAAIGLVLLAAVPAAANFSAPYKFSAAGKTYVYLPNQTAGAVVPFTTLSTEPTNIEFDYGCGWKFLKRQVTTTKQLVAFRTLDGKVNSSTATANNDFKPDCANGGWNFTIGTVYQTAEGWWVMGGLGYENKSAEVTYSKSAKVTANACGFARLATSATRTLEAFSVAGTNHTLAALPVVSAPQICKAPFTGAPKVLYQPQ